MERKIKVLEEIKKSYDRLNFEKEKVDLGIVIDFLKGKHSQLNLLKNSTKTLIKVRDMTESLLLYVVDDELIEAYTEYIDVVNWAMEEIEKKIKEKDIR
ncbi:hypothetical protein UMC2_35461 [[Clostridium] sordellii]|uniref:hypothetical protein n=1 Tax=Paraclostridium sordellii TaxID=1505 RepID=UPI000543E732|nr:hypothetical protein [Paeniclostridium sordellii]CEK34335.1 hypothetical protein UMC2_35461 [[Clostridium] sordellii] [Paeniclostridium sordellii]